MCFLSWLKIGQIQLFSSTYLNYVAFTFLLFLLFICSLCAFSFGLLAFFGFLPLIFSLSLSFSRLKPLLFLPPSLVKKISLDFANLVQIFFLLVAELFPLLTERDLLVFEVAFLAAFCLRKSNLKGSYLLQIFPFPHHHKA